MNRDKISNLVDGLKIVVQQNEKARANTLIEELNSNHDLSEDEKDLIRETLHNVSTHSILQLTMLIDAIITEKDGSSKDD